MKQLSKIFQSRELIILQNIISNIQKSQLIRNFFRLNIKMSHFDQLPQIQRQKEESLNIQNFILKNSLRGGGCACCNCQKMVVRGRVSNYQQLPENQQPRTLNVEEVKVKVIEAIHQNDQLQQFIPLIKNFDNNCVIFTYQTISIYFELMRKQEFLKIQKNQLIQINRSILSISQDPEWFKIMFKFYFELLKQANEYRPETNIEKYKLLSDFSKQEQYDNNQWEELKKQKGKFSPYETFYFYQMSLNKLIQPNSFGISLDKFVNDFIKNQDQEKQIKIYQIFIAAQLNLVYVLGLTKKYNQLKNFIKTVYEVKQIFTQDDEYFLNSIIKQQDISYKEIQIWLSYHFLILEHTENVNKSIQDQIKQFFDNHKVYQSPDSVQKLKSLRTRWNLNNNQQQVIESFVNIPNDSSIQQFNYKDQLDIVRKKKKELILEQKVDYITPLINIKTSSSNLKYIFDEEIIKNLFSTNQEDIYWIFGKVKSGKTTLTMTIIDYLWKKTDWIPIYFDLTDIEQRNGNLSELLKITLRLEPFHLIEQQIQDFLNADQKLIIFLDYYDQLSFGFRKKNIMKMLGCEVKKENQKVVLITREQVQDLPAYQPLIQRMIQIELKEFNEKQKKEYIEKCIGHLMDENIDRNQININVQQMISIDFNDGQMLIHDEHIRQFKLQLTQENYQSKKNIQKKLLNMIQLNFMMKNIFVPCFSFHYQFKLLLKLITSKNSQNSPQRFQEYNTSKNLIAHYQEQQKKQFKQLLNSISSSSSDINSPSSKNEEPIEIDKILDSIMTKSNQKYRLQQGDMLIKQILNPKLTKFEYINSLIDQYIEDYLIVWERLCLPLNINMEKVREFQTNLALPNQQNGSNESGKQNKTIKIIKRCCLLKSDGEKKIFLDKVFKDFFIANFVFIKISEFQKDKSKEKLGKFNNFNLCQNDYTETVALLSDQLLTINKIKDVLIQLIKLSTEESFIKTSSNSMYLLSILKLNLEGEDLSKIHISDINITGLSFYLANLCNSHWKNVDISFCNFNSTDLTGAKLEQIIGIIETQNSGQLQIKQKENTKIIGVLDPRSIQKNTQLIGSQDLKSVFNNTQYISFQREDSQLQDSSEKNHSIQNSEIQIINDKNEVIKILKPEQHCSSFCFFAQKKNKLVCSLSKDGIKYKINIWNYDKNDNNLKEIEDEFDIITKMATKYINDKSNILVLLLNYTKIMLYDLSQKQDYSYFLCNPKESQGDNFTVSNCHQLLAVSSGDVIKIYDWQMIQVFEFSSRNDWRRLVICKNKQGTDIFYSKIENALYSPDGQNIVIQSQSKTEFYQINTDTTFIELEKVKSLVFSNNYFVTSSDQGIKIYSFPEYEYIDWLPFKAQLLIFSYKQDQNLAIISHCNYNFIYRLENIEKIPQKIDVFNYKFDNSSLIIAVSPNKKQMIIAQNGLIFFVKNMVYKDKIMEYQDEMILSMCFAQKENHFAIRSKKNKLHIFRVINFETLKPIAVWEEENQTEDQEFSNQIQCLLIQSRRYVISNQNNQLVLQDVTECFENQQQNQDCKIKKTPIILKPIHKEDGNSKQQLQQNSTVNFDQQALDKQIESMLCFNFSISQDQNYIAARFSLENKKFSTIIIIWKYIDNSTCKYEYEQKFYHNERTNLYFLEYENLLLLIFKEQKQTCIQVFSIENKNYIKHCEQKSDQDIQSIAFSSDKQQFYTMHSPTSFSLYFITKEQLEQKYYFEETEIPIYFSLYGTDVIYMCQQSIFIRNVDDIIDRIKHFYSNSVKLNYDEKIGICFSDNITYFNHNEQKIYQYSKNQLNKISLDQQEMSINCSQFSQDEQILIIITSNEGTQQQLRILFKIENNYIQQNEILKPDNIIYSCKFVTNNSFLVLSQNIQIYDISDCKLSVQQQINLPGLYIKSINFHPNKKDFLTINESGQIQLYNLIQSEKCKYKLYKTLPENQLVQAQDCVISNLNASKTTIQQLKELGAIDPGNTIQQTS
ncbi:unnamed protein product [Paramecium octaurelia]|uniref:WD40-repeat-containing domain n=1 Tax=Paramecium octaurelia TaxID=43137 RepID=A0A8S1WDU3_PAROT|nr:unnamed protein product [Paramecium octaurelia]